MKRIRHFLGIFNYGITWLGLIRIACAAGCVWGCIALYKSDEPLFLRIFGILIMLLGLFGCLVSGWENLKEGYSHLKYRDAERLIYRAPVSSDDEDQ